MVEYGGGEDVEMKKGWRLRWGDVVVWEFLDREWVLERESEILRVLKKRKR